MAKKKTRTGYVRIDLPVVEMHWWDLSPLGCKVYIILLRASRERRAGGEWPSRGKLAEAAGCSERTIDRALKELQDADLIRIVARSNPSGGSLPNGYVLRKGETK